MHLRNECLCGCERDLYYRNADTEALILAKVLGSVSDILKIIAASTRASTEALGCDKLEDADSSSEAETYGTEAAAAAEKSEESDSTEDSLAVYSADHNLPAVASSTATVYRIEATNLMP
jgi:hypothetical protein